MLRTFGTALLFILIFQIQAQVPTIVAAPGEYMPPVNYGGKPELRRFLKGEMSYPETALKNKVRGSVVLSFIVDKKTGKCSGIRFVKSVSKELDGEAMRLFKRLLFIPGNYKGKAVTCYGSLKIRFSPAAYKRYCKNRGYEEIDFNDPTIDYSNKIYNGDEVNIQPVPLFKDTLETLPHFIRKRLKYPPATLNLNLTGLVKLFFVVEPTGRISNIRVLRGVGGGATNETERILKLLTWQSGQVGGKKVRVGKTLEVNFNLTDDSGYKYVPSRF